MSDISIICVWNNENQYKNLLIKSLENQDVSYELIGIDNRQNQFLNCASALNYGGHCSKGKVLIFVHQDIIFKKKTSLREFAEFIEKHPNSICGSFGARKETFEDMYRCDTVDECCFGMLKSTYDKLKFNEKICDNWHLYAVEMCLRGKDNNIVSLCYNSGIEHCSGGVVNKEYMKNFKVLLKVYKHQGYIWTTCKKMPCNMLYYNIYYVFWRLKKFLFGNYHLAQLVKSKLHINDGNL